MNDHQRLEINECGERAWYGWQPIQTTARLSFKIHHSFTKTMLICYSRHLKSHLFTHWLQLPQRVKYKLSILIYHCLYNMAPAYLWDDLPTSSLH